MTRSARVTCMAALATGLLAGVAPASPPFDGRWASAAPACASESEATATLIVSAFVLRWRDAACVIQRSYLLRDTWNIGARCVADGAAANVPIRLELRGERLLFDWGGTPAQELTRCP